MNTDVLPNGPDAGDIPAGVKMSSPRLWQGNILFLIQDMKEDILDLRDGSKKKIVTANLLALEPTDTSGIQFDQQWWIGTDTDPLAQQIETWRGRDFGNVLVMAQKAGVNISGKRQVLYSECRNRKVVGRVTYTDKGFARIRDWFEVGSVELKASAPPTFQAPQGAVPGPGGAGARPAGSPPPPPVMAGIPSKLAR